MLTCMLLRLGWPPRWSIYVCLLGLLLRYRPAVRCWLEGLAGLKSQGVGASGARWAGLVEKLGCSSIGSPCPAPPPIRRGCLRCSCPSNFQPSMLM